MEKGDIYVYRGELDKADEEYHKLLDPRLGAQGNYFYKAIHLNPLQGKFTAAEKLAATGADLGRQMGERWLEILSGSFRADCLRMSGKLKEALEEYERVWKLAAADEDLLWQRAALLQKGLISLGMNSVEQAQKEAEALRPLVDMAMNKTLIRMINLMDGSIELKRDNVTKAIALFESAVGQLPHQLSMPSDGHAPYYDALASAYYKAGDLDKARQEYEKILALTTGRINHPDIYSKSFYMPAKISEEQGKKDEAAKNFRKFLDLWKDADPGIPEVAEARKSLAVLNEM